MPLDVEVNFHLTSEEVTCDQHFGYPVFKQVFKAGILYLLMLGGHRSQTLIEIYEKIPSSKGIRTSVRFVSKNHSTLSYSTEGISANMPNVIFLTVHEFESATVLYTTEIGICLAWESNLQ